MNLDDICIILQYSMRQNIKIGEVLWGAGWRWPRSLAVWLWPTSRRRLPMAFLGSCWMAEVVKFSRSNWSCDVELLAFYAVSNKFCAMYCLQGSQCFWMFLASLATRFCPFSLFVTSVIPSSLQLFKLRGRSHPGFVDACHHQWPWLLDSQLRVRLWLDVARTFARACCMPTKEIRKKMQLRWSLKQLQRQDHCR